MEPAIEPEAYMDAHTRAVMTRSAKSELDHDVSALHPKRWLFTSIGLSIIMTVAVGIMLLVVQPPFVNKHATSEIARPQVSLLIISGIAVGAGLMVYIMGILARKSFLNEQTKKVQRVEDQMQRQPPNIYSKEA